MIDVTRKPGDVPSPAPSLTERVIIMVSWNDLFLFVTMIVAIMAYIDTHDKHKK